MHQRRRNIILGFFFIPVILLACTLSAGAAQYQVASGDSLFLIAQRYGISVNELKSLNGLSGNTIYPGQTLVVGSTTGSSSYTVKSGDSLYLIALRHGTTVSALRAANGLSGDAIYPGEKLTMTTGSTGSGGSSSSGWTYMVKAGDSLYSLAMKYGTSVSALQQANGLGTGTTIYQGQSLCIPSSSSSASRSTGSISSSDIELLARLVTAEAGGEPFTGQVAVAASVLNRLKDPKFPDTIANIIYQYSNGAYQYSPVMDGRINLPASSDATKAVQDALNGWDPSGGATGFYNPAKTSSSWVRSQLVTTVIGNHVFYKY